MSRAVFNQHNLRFGRMLYARGWQLMLWRSYEGQGKEYEFGLRQCGNTDEFKADLDKLCSVHAEWIVSRLPTEELVLLAAHEDCPDVVLRQLQKQDAAG